MSVPVNTSTSRARDELRGRGTGTEKGLLAPGPEEGDLRDRMARGDASLLPARAQGENGLTKVDPASFFPATPWGFGRTDRMMDVVRSPRTTPTD